MSRDALELAVLVLTGSNIAVFVAWLFAKRRILQLDRHREVAASDDRTDRLENALEELAGRVDQISRAQEFINRYVFERRSRSSSKRLAEGEPKEATPH